MRTITAQQITDTVARLCIEANTRLPRDVQEALDKARAEEPWPLAKNTLDLLWSNLAAAREEDLPICQDTGMACVFVELGTDVHIDGSFETAIHEGVRRGYTDGYLRKSIVADPLRRGNTGDNTPAAITVHLVDGDGCTITVAPKGFGSENMSRIQMLKPADGVEGFKKFVIETVKLAGSNPCPPIVLGIGVVLLNLERLPGVLQSIFEGAFNPAAFTGGIIGSLFVSMQKGVSRGIFSNEAGLGTGSIAHACADTQKPVTQGMFGIFEVFADTIIICTLTALVILCSGTPVTYGVAAGAELTISGFTTTYGSWSSIFTAVALCCFAFSTIIGWGLYGSRFVQFLFKSNKVVRPFLVIYSFVSILGATLDLGLLWDIADTFNGLMSIPNLIALLLLSGMVVKLTKEHFPGKGAVRKTGE